MREGFTDEGVAACNTCNWALELHEGTRVQLKITLDGWAVEHLEGNEGHTVDVIVTERWIEHLEVERDTAIEVEGLTAGEYFGD